MVSIFDIRQEIDPTRIEASRLIAQAAGENEIKKVMAVGRGKTPNAAVQDAAANALLEVVGAFMDKEVISRTKLRLKME